MTSPDLVVIVPSRGRPRNVARLAAACKATCTANTELHFGFDDDDPHLQANVAAASEAGATFQVAPRRGLAEWTNVIASGRAKDAPYLASLGDDMTPVTPGWDSQLLAAIAARGGTGFAYPNDGRRADIPEAVVVSSDIVRRLAWMALPTSRHWFIDNVWADLGRGADCITYCGKVMVPHLHPNVRGGDPSDATYNQAAGSYDRDLTAYQTWRFRQLRRDVAAIRELIKC